MEGASVRGAFSITGPGIVGEVVPTGGTTGAGGGAGGMDMAGGGDGGTFTSTCIVDGFLLPR